MVHTPYTAFFVDAFMAAHGAIGVMLVALLWWTFPKANVARSLLLAAIALLVTAPMLGDFFHGFGSNTPPLVVEQRSMLVASGLVVGAMIALARFPLAVVALLVAALLLKLNDWVQDSWSELCALHLVWVGAALGLIRRRAPVDDVITPPATTSFARHDVALFAIATLAATIVSIFVLQRADGSADEWAYTWQAAVFAKGHVYADAPPCDSAFQSFYVFWSMGRQFSQYTPGWPFFMTPFVALGVPWLAGPFSHGLMVVGVARVARSAVRLDGHGPSRRRQSVAGWVAGLVATFGTTILLCGASRYSHVFVAALFAWAIEALLVVTGEGTPRQRKLRWAVLFGSLVALMGATRPADGVTLSAGLGVYFLYALARRRIDWHAFLGVLAGLVFWGGLTLVILRVQLGSWFTTGYSLNKVIHPWNVTTYGWPRPNEWKFALPLATGSYAWFPCSLAVGAAGIASLRRGAKSVLAVLVVSSVCFEIFYQYITLGRGFDWGYGPRFELPLVVPMAVGGGIAIAPLFDRRRLGGPAAVVAVTMVVTLVRLWPLLYPGIYAHVRQHDSLNARIREMNIHDAVVIVQPGATGFDVRDLTENLPITLYPKQDVLIAIDRSPESTRCVRSSYGDRKVYRASGNPVVIVPW